MKKLDSTTVIMLGCIIALTFIVAYPTLHEIGDERVKERCEIACKKAGGTLINFTQEKFWIFNLGELCQCLINEVII